MKARRTRQTVTPRRGRDWKASPAPRAHVTPAALELFTAASGLRRSTYGLAVELLARAVTGRFDARPYLTPAQYATFQREKRNATRHSERIVRQDRALDALQATTNRIGKKATR